MSTYCLFPTSKNFQLKSYTVPTMETEKQPMDKLFQKEMLGIFKQLFTSSSNCSLTHCIGVIQLFVYLGDLLQLIAVA